MKVILSIFGDVFRLEDINNIVKMSPTSFWQKGDIVPHMNKTLARLETCWEYSIESETLFFEEISDILIEKFSRSLKDLAFYVEQNNLAVKVDIVVKIENGQLPSVFLNRRFLELINKLGAEIDLDLYNYS
jgi:hypothetical protein